MRRFIGVVAAAALACFGGSGASSAERVAGLWLFTYGPDRPTTVTALDPTTLAALRTPLRLGPAYPAHGPDGAFTAMWTEPRRGTAALLLVDLRRLRVAGRVPVPARLAGTPHLRWLTPTLAFAVEKDEVFALDFTTRSARRVARLPARLDLLAPLAASPEALVALLPPKVEFSSPGRAVRLAVVTRSGRLRIVTLARMINVTFGVLPTKGCAKGDGAFVARHPALAVNRAKNVAYVVGIDRIAELDLGTARVSYHRIGTGGRGRWRGWTRAATVLTDGRLALAGADTRRARDNDCGNSLSTEERNLVLVDTRTWHEQVHPARGSALVLGREIVEDGDGRVSVFTLDGRKRFTLRFGPGFPDRFVSGGGDRLYVVKHVTPLRSRDPLRSEVWVVDRRTGRELTRVRVGGTLGSVENATYLQPY